MKKFVTFGEPMVMFVAQQEGSLAVQENFKKFMAGAEVNVAIGMARLGYDTYLSSRVGCDSFGQFIVNALKKENINTDDIVVDRDWPTGYQVKSRVHEGDPEVEYYRKFSAFRQQNKRQIDGAWLQSGNHMHVTGIPLALSARTCDYSFAMMKKARENGMTVSFDPNLRPALWNSSEEMRRVINRAAAFADCVLPGIAEGEILTGEKEPDKIAAFYLRKGVGQVVIKLGSKGAYYHDKNNRKGTVAGVKNVQVVDTVGAGDGFAAGFISASLEGCSMERALRRGNAIGALAVQSPGDSDGLPDRQVLEAFMETYYQ